MVRAEPLQNAPPHRSALPVVALAGSDISPGGPAGGSEAGAGGQIDGGSLPFTGLNLAIILIAAAVLIGAGLLLRRRAARHS